MLLLLRSSLRPLRVNGTLRYASTANTTKPYYITTPIFYPNASPHIGHLYSLVTADVFARYERLKDGADYDVRFLAGTDEHGMKIQKAAKKHFGIGGREKEFCDSLSERFRDLGKKASISNTCFMRTTSVEHRKAVEDVWARLDTKGYIYKGQYSGWYSITDECFYTDSQVTKTVDQTQSISIETGNVVEWTSEENYLFRLSAFRDDLLKYYTSHPKSIFPQQYREDVLGVLESGIADISISRPRSRLEWGIQVLNDPTQTVYVWFDALLIYLTGSGYPWPATDGTGCWPADVQVIGKDILKFHAIYLPAILLGLSSPPTEATTPLARTLLTHAHWTSSQKKMSKSLGNVADPLEAMDKWGVDVVRFYMMRVGGRWEDDVDWSPAQLEKHSKEIQSQLGNYFLRVTSPRLSERVKLADELTLAKCLSQEIQDVFLKDDSSTSPLEVIRSGGELLSGTIGDPNAELLRAVRALPHVVHECMDNFEVGLALEMIMLTLKKANKVLTDIAPWKPPTSPSEIHVTCIVALETVRVVSGCLEPIMPGVAESVRTALGVDAGGESVMDQAKLMMKEGGHEEMRRFWDRWSRREVKGVRLF